METETSRTPSVGAQPVITPVEALARLKAGNARFVANRRANRNLLEQVNQTSDGQHPFAAVLGCIDSRAVPELVFDQGIGDIFSVRIAGNIINKDILGSLEFACKIMRSKLIIVLGHSKCGAITGACDGIRLGHLSGLLDRLKPAVDVVTMPDGAACSGQNAAFVQQVAEKNVMLTMAAIPAQSQVLREMLDNGDIMIAGAMYDVETGVVTFF